MIAIILAILLSALPCHAVNLHQAMMAVCTPQGSGCNPASDYVGYTTQRTTPMNLPGTDDGVFAPYTATCSGTLGYGYAWHEAGSGTDSAKICVYRVSDRAKIACSTAITSSVDGEWKKTTDKLGGSVVSGTSYFVGLVTDSSVWTNGFTSDGAVSIYSVLEVGYASPVDPLPAAEADPITTADLSVYVEIE